MTALVGLSQVAVAAMPNAGPVPHGWMPLAHEPDPPPPRFTRLVAQLGDGFNFLSSSAGPQNARTYAHQLTPEVFVKPFPAPSQQYDAMPWQGELPTTATPWGWWGQQLECLFKLPVPAALQIYETEGEHSPIATAFFGEGWRGLQWDYLFGKPFPPPSQQYDADGYEYEVPSPVVPEGWQGLVSEEYGFARPFPIGAQPFIALPARPVPVKAAPGWDVYRYEYRFAKHFPVASQQYVSSWTFGRTPSYFPEGWSAYQWSHQFATPFPVDEHQTLSYGRGIPTIPVPEGWFNYELDYLYAKPFPAEQQQFFATLDLRQIPPNLPPGSGKRRHFPSYIPQPPRDVEPQKPFRPVWDRGGKIEKPKEPKPSGPPPLPPLSIFGQTGTTRLLSPAGLPTFNEYVPHDSLAMSQRLNDALEESDAMAALRAVGIIKDDEE